MVDAGPILIHDLLSVCLKHLERRLQGRDVRIVRQIDRTSPEVHADRECLRHVIETILAEAAAVTVDGGRIRVCLKHNRAAVMLSVKDQGPGMPPDARDVILTDTSRARREEAPLTLPECLETIRSMRGTLFVNSAPGKGSTFYATFPPPAPGLD
ncbi:MAG: hypothetical protein HY049_15630 [Acidobacteria bacterium]|nr:hypothetical protein [Acidobacteriota bacterium]